MPIYEYICEECATRYEKLVLRPNGERVTCPKCGSARHTLQFSTFSTTSSASDNSAAACEAPVCMRTPRGCGCH